MLPTLPTGRGSRRPARNCPTRPSSGGVGRAAPDPVVHHDGLLGSARDGIVVLEEPQGAPGLGQEGEVREWVLAGQAGAAGVSGCQAVENLCPAVQREESAPCPPQDSQAPPPRAPRLPPRPTPGLTADGPPGRGPGSCRMAGRCSSRSSNGPPGPRRRRNLRSARETPGAGPPAPPPSSCTGRQSSRRGCQTGPVGTPQTRSPQCQSLLGTGARGCGRDPAYAVPVPATLRPHPLLGAWEGILADGKTNIT